MSAESVLREIEARQRGWMRWRFWFVLLVVLVFYSLAWHTAGIDLEKLARGIPKLAFWISTAWPPQTE